MHHRQARAPSWWPDVVTAFGGLHRFGPLWVIIHDRGVAICWRQVERLRWEW